MDKNCKCIKISNGNIAIGHRPKLKSFVKMKEAGITHVVTILSEKEGAKEIIKHAEKAGLNVIWIPLGNADIVYDKIILELIYSALEEISLVLEDGGNIFMHCSAGIHRTGMIMHALLNYLGFGEDEALRLLKQMREVTFLGVGKDRIRWGEQFRDQWGQSR